MAWEKRKTGTYYYEKKRVNGKTVSIYWGNGELAREREQQIRLRRVSKRAKRLVEKEDKEFLNEVSSRGKQALQLLLVSVAKLYRLKGRRVPKMCAKAVKAERQNTGGEADSSLNAQSKPQIDTTKEFVAQPAAVCASGWSKARPSPRTL